MQNNDNWNLKDIFENNEAFEICKKELNEILEDLKKYQGKLAQSSETICACYVLYEKALEKYEKIYAYGMLTFHLDMSKPEGVKLFKEVENIGVSFEMATSFIGPEMCEIPEEKLQHFLQENENLVRYQRILQDILEKKKHILSKQEESLLSFYGEVFSNAENTYDVLTNTEFPYGNLIDEKGKLVEMTDGTYVKFLRSKEEKVRKQAFDLMYDKYAQFQNTITELYLARVKQNTITSKIRHYQSSLEKAVLQDDSSILVYEKLIETVNQNLAVNHRFMELKKKMLQTKDLHLYDIYQNPLETEDDKISFAYAKKEVLEGLAILGKEYMDKLKEAFENSWLDVYEKPNKRTGAYSMGVYGIHPFVLTNFVGSRRDVSTIAHELGHSMHSYYSNQTQPILDSNYTILVAEVASTVNEILLAHYQIETQTDPHKKAELLYELVEMIRATLFRQAMFAEFEKMVHEKIEGKEILSCKELNQMYYELNQKYFGKAVIIDEKIQYEWLRIPHFYSCFYVYKYATGISSAIAIADKILKKEPGFVEKYIEMLKQGCSKKSIELLKMVEVDLETTKPYEAAIQFYQEKIEALEKFILL